MYFTLLMMIPLAVVGWFIYTVSDTRMCRSALQLSSQIMNNVSMDLDQLFDDADNLISLVVSDSSIQQCIHEQSIQGNDRQELQLQMNQRMKRLSAYYDSINGAYLLLDNNMVAKSRYYAEREQHNMPSGLYQLARNRAGIQWVVSEKGSMLVDNMGDSVLCGVSSLTDTNTGQPCGVVIVEIKLSVIRKMMQVDMGENSNVFLMGTEGDLLVELFNNDKQDLLVKELMQKEAMSNKLKVYENQEFFVLCQRFSADGCAIVGLVYKDFIRADSRKILETILKVAAIAFLINIVVSRLLKTYELQPIEDMMQYVQRVEEGDFSAKMNVSRTDEMGRLSGSMYHMTKHIESLLQTVQKEQERLRWAEFKALQAQINPHFLYNTLDSIKWLVWNGENQKASEMITALTDFFRRVLSQGKDFISIEDEVDHVESYLKIQKIRYRKIFDYTIYVEEGLETCIIPKLLLQPIVENALYHGIKPGEHKGKIRINIVSLDENLVLEVRDDGVGMTVEKQTELVKSIEKSEGTRFESYGMGNINDRIHILAGSEYGISIISDLGIGTSVSIRLPRTLGGEIDNV